MTNIERLLALQELDCRIRDIEREMRDIPARKDAETQRLSRHKAAVGETAERMKASHAEIKSIELEIESRRERITRLRRQQTEIKTNKEFRALEDEIRTEENGIRSVEDREIEAMERMEAIRTDLSEREAALSEEDRKVQGDILALDARVVRLQSELAELQSRRGTSLSGINAAWLERYALIMTRRDRALVKLADGVCGGCHMKLPPSAYHDTRNTDTVTTCNFCGRMLYS